jgi:putative endonuclease
MAATTYILYSEKWNQYYVGSTQDLTVRLEQHNSGKNTSTRGGAPWLVKYEEHFSDISLARRRELEIKKKKSRKYIEWLIASSDA